MLVAPRPMPDAPRISGMYLHNLRSCLMDIVFADCPVVSGPAFEESDLMQTRPPQRNLPRLYMFMACTHSYTRGCVDHREYIVYSEIAFAPWRDRGTHRGHLRCGTPLQTASNASATGG